ALRPDPRRDAARSHLPRACVCKPGASAARHEQAEPREPGWCQQEQPIRCTRRVLVPAQRPLARGGHARRPQVSRRLLRRSQRSRRSRSGTTQPAVHAQRQRPYRDRRITRPTAPRGAPHPKGNHPMNLPKTAIRDFIAAALALASTVVLVIPAAALTRWNRDTVTIENRLDSTWPVETAVGPWHRASGLDIVVVDKCPVMKTSCVVLDYGRLPQGTLGKV